VKTDNTEYNKPDLVRGSSAIISIIFNIRLTVYKIFNIRLTVYKILSNKLQMKSVIC